MAEFLNVQACVPIAPHGQLATEAPVQRVPVFRSGRFSLDAHLRRNVIKLCFIVTDKVERRLYLIIAVTS